MREQTTLGGTVTSHGVGLHSGEASVLTLRPAAPDTGIVFQHHGSGARIPAVVSHAQELAYATRLGLGDTTVSTVEHLLSALRGVQVDNVVVEIDGDEVPILDGSADPFVAMIDRAGVCSLNRPATTLRITAPIEAREGEKWIRIDPADELTVDYRISFDNPIVGFQRYVGRVTPDVYREAVAPARTFGFLKDVQYLKSRGLAQGGSLTNCVVIDEQRVVSGELRFPPQGDGPHRRPRPGGVPPPGRHHGLQGRTCAAREAGPIDSRQPRAVGARWGRRPRGIHHAVPHGRGRAHGPRSLDSPRIRCGGNGGRERRARQSFFWGRVELPAGNCGKVATP